MPESVKELAFLVVSRSDRGYGLPDVKGAGLIDPGFTVTAATLKAHIGTLAKEVATHTRTLLIIQPVPFGPGLQVTAMVPPLPKPKPEPDPNDGETVEVRHQPDARQFFYDSVTALKHQESAEAVIVVALHHGRQSNSITWLVEKGTAKPAKPEALGEFETALQALADEPGFAAFQVSIQILTKADADLLEQSSRE